jgi:hypothetical protein
LTVTVKLQMELLPDASVAVHTTLVVPFAKLFPDAGTHTIEPPAQLSVKLTAKLTLLLHCPAAAPTVMFPGQLGTGRSVSSIVTVKLQLVSPQLLDAVQLTGVVPLGKLAPLVTNSPLVVQVTVGAGLPVAVTTNATLLEHWLGALGTVMSAGQEMVGTVFTVSVAIAELMLPQMLENTARNWLLLCEMLAAKLNGLLVAPGIFVNPPPLSACHCNVGAGKPLPAAVNDATAPAHTFVLTGFVVTTEPVLIARVATAEVVLPQVLENTARY